MGLIRCKNCNTLISDNNNICPKCNNIVLKENVEMIYDNEENSKKLDTEHFIGENKEDNYVREENEKKLVSESFISEKMDGNEAIDEIKETKKLNIIVNVEIIVIILLSLILLLYFINFISKDLKNKESNKEELKTTITTEISTTSEIINTTSVITTTSSTTTKTTTTRKVTTTRVDIPVTQPTTRITTKSTTKVTTKRQKNIIDAEKEYYCDNKYVLKDNECFLRYTAEVIYNCPPGYKVAAHDECVSELDTVMAPTCRCYSGSAIGNKCYGYTYEGFSYLGSADCYCRDYRYYYDGMSCRLDDSYRYITSYDYDYYCYDEATKTKYKTNDTSCIDTIGKPAKIKYICPDGYELNETKCIEK